jgi:hypothetical protein
MHVTVAQICCFGCVCAWWPLRNSSSATPEQPDHAATIRPESRSLGSRECYSVLRTIKELWCVNECQLRLFLLLSKAVTAC